MAHHRKEISSKVVTAKTVADEGERKTFVARWITRQMAKIKAGGSLTGAVLALPAIAQAQAGPDFVSAGSIDGVTGAQAMGDGTARLTMQNGSTISVPAGDFAVGAGGQLMVSARIVEVAAEVMAAGAGAGVGIGAGAVAAGAGVAGGALAMGGGGGDGGNDAALSSLLSQSGTPPTVLNNSAVLSANGIGSNAIAYELPEGTQQVRVTFDDGSENPRTETVAVDGDGNWVVPLPDGETPADLPQGASDITIVALDGEGEELGDKTIGVVIDTLPPALEITGVDTGEDEVLNTAEQSQPLTVTGTSDAENGQEVTVTVNGVEYSATVRDGAWTADVPAEDLAALPDGATIDVLANVTDAAGNPAETASTRFDTDFGAPTINIDAVSDDNQIGLIDVQGDLEVTGVTTAEPGQTVTLVFNGVEYQGDVLSNGAVDGNSWAVTVPQSALQAVQDAAGEDELAQVELSASVSDAAANPSDAATLTIDADFRGPSVAIDAIADDNIIDASENGANVAISGTTNNVQPGQVVTVSVNGTALQDAPVQANGNWETTLLAADVTGLADGGSFAVEADVSDAEGVAAPTATVQLAKDVTAPTISITSVSAGSVYNLEDSNGDLAISGTTDAEDDQEVTVSVAGTDFTTNASGGAWSLTILNEDLPAISDGDTVSVTADVSDVAGNAATTATTGFDADLSAPEITITGPIADDGTLNITEQTDGFTLAGTAVGAEDGQTVTINVGGTNFTETVDGEAWSLDLTSGDLSGISDGDTVSVTADVSDAAGNAAETATASFDADLSAPEITITGPIADDGTLNITEQTDGFTLAGTAVGAENDQTVTINVGGTDFTETVDGEAWSLDLTSDDLSGISDGDTVPVTADVSDVAGNAADQATASFDADLVAPTISFADPPPAGYVLTLAELAEDPIVGFDVLTDAPDGTSADLLFLDDSGSAVLQRVSHVSDGGTYTIDFSGDGLLSALSDQTSYTVTINVADDAGNTDSDSFDIETDFKPTVTLDDVGTDGAVDLSDLENASISGTALGADGQEVTVTFTDTTTSTVIGTATGTISAGIWTAPVGDDVLEQLEAGSTYLVAADVSNADGRAADTVSQTVDAYLASEFGYVVADESGADLTVAAITGDTFNSNDGFRSEITFDPAAAQHIAGSFAENGDLDLFLENEDEAASGELIAGGGTFSTPLPEGSQLFTFGLTDQGAGPITVRFDNEVADTPSGSAELIVGTEGADTLTADKFDSFVQGRGGDDTIDVSASGSNFVVFDSLPTDNGTDTVLGFTNAFGDQFADEIAFIGAIDLKGDGDVVEPLADGSAVGANTGFVIFTTAQTSVSASDAFDMLNGIGANESFYLMAGDGTDAELALVSTDGSGAASFDTMANFEGVGGLDRINPDQILLPDPTGAVPA